MGHNLSKNSDGVYSFFSVKQKAWHGLGQIVQDYPTSAEAMKFAGLDYEVVKQPLFTDPSGRALFNPDRLLSGIIDGGDEDSIDLSRIIVPDHFATLRTDTDEVLGVVGRDYQVVQNSEAFGFFDAIVGGDEGVMYETAGALGNGERVFITAKLPDYIRVGDSDDVIEKYIFLTTSHDGSGSITAAFTPVRIVCQNTLNVAMRNMSNVVRIRHTSGAQDRLKEAHRVMGIANKLGTQLEEVFNHWSTVRITDEQVKKLIQMAMCPNKETMKLIQTDNEQDMSAIFRNTVDKAFAYAMMSDTQKMETTKGTVFGAYNAVTGYFQNVRNYKDDEEKLKSIIYGGTAQSKAQKAFELCTDFVKDGADIFNLS